MGSIPSRGNKMCVNIFFSLWCQDRLNSASQQAMSPEFDGKWRTEVSKWEQSALTLGDQVHSIYTAMRVIQCEA